MKLTTFIIFLAVMQVSARSFGQRVTLSQKDAPLVQVFDQIHAQTGVDFMFTSSVLNEAHPVTIRVENMDLKAVLAQLFNGQPLEYSIEDKTVVVSKKATSLIADIKSVLNLPVTVAGRVVDTTGQALAGATVTVKGSDKRVIADQDGRFLIAAEKGNILIISYVGYINQEVIVGDKSNYQIVLHDDPKALKEVIVNNGYQTLSNERATGSFDYIDNKLLNRSVGFNILDRLTNVTSGVIFNKSLNSVGGSSLNGGDPVISIRGRSTIFSNTEPLIVLDNFPYAGSLDNINPNDVESITVLKDASASSIWGTRAGNGVIVITTKKGKFNSPPKVSISSTITIADKPNLYARPQLSSLEYINVEKYLFQKGYYNTNLKYLPYRVESPVVDLLWAIKNNPQDSVTLNQKIDALNAVDVRNQYSKYFLRRAINQQYAMNLAGGSENEQYYFSAGYDNDLASNVANQNNRLTLNGNNTFQFFNKKLELNTSIIFTKSQSKSGQYQYSPAYPYEELADANGNALPVIRDFRQAYKDALSGLPFLDWNYYPLNERFNQGFVSSITDYHLVTGLTYRLNSHFNIKALYQYSQGLIDQTFTQVADSYSARLLINQYSQIDSTGNIIRNIPLGDIVQPNSQKYTNQNARVQVSYNQLFARKHYISGIAGYEILKNDIFNRSGAIEYGYNQDTQTNTMVDYTTEFPMYLGGGANRIPFGLAQNSSAVRQLSYFANIGYTFDDKYSLNISARRDESNLFGVKANQKGVPLWSTGVGWEINKESFYHSDFLPYLKLRITDGVSGNVDQSLSAYTTAGSNGGQQVNIYNYPSETIINPPNPSLRWEKVNQINLGIDFAVVGHRISGSLDFYRKKGLDLIGNSVIAPQTGIVQFTGNNSSTQTDGLDLKLDAIILDGKFKWVSNFLFNYVNNKVTKYDIKQPNNSQIVGANYSNPVVGKPYSSLFSFNWAGLDDKGNPQGYLDGKVSEDYAAILNSKDPTQLVYNGSATPTIFGGLVNNFSFKDFELSFNIVYKLNYYFRRGSYNLTDGYLQADYEQRWQKPGDEIITNVPSAIYPDASSGLRSRFYKNSSILIVNGDHVRLQDIRLTYSLNRNTLVHSPFTAFRLSLYANNLGILWAANKLGLDPDYSGKGVYNIPDPRTYSLSITANFK